METSLFLARVLGLFCVISATAVLVRYKKNMAHEKELVTDPAVAMLAGYAILILGILLVVSHSIWTFDWRLVITILSWMVLFKGIGRIFLPEAVKNMIERKQKDMRFLMGEIILILVGLYLLYYGFIVF